MPNPNKKDARIYAILDQMSTEALEEMLRLDSQMPGCDGSDMEQILYIMEVLARREMERPSGRYKDADAAWKSFNQNYRPDTEEVSFLSEDSDDEDTDRTKLIGVVQNPSAATPKTSVRSPAFHRSLRTARLAAAVLAVMMGCMAVAQAFGFDVLGAIARWTEETFRLGVSSQSREGQATGDPAGGDTQYATLQEALEVYGVHELLAPTWVPDGFDKGEVTVTPQPGIVKFKTTYRAQEKYLSVTIWQYETVEARESKSFEKDGANVTLYECGGNVHYIMSNNERMTATWEDGKTICSISGELTEEELMQIIDSIYEECTK